MKRFWAVFYRDIRLGWRHKGEILLVPAFFLLLLLLFPLALGPDPVLIRTTVPGLLAVAALLATLLPLERLFLADREDGSLDLMVREQGALLPYAAAKITAHWLLTGFLLVLLTPLPVLLLGLPVTLLLPSVSVMLGMTVCLTLIGALGAALTLGTRQGSILLALLVLPLYIPVLIFGGGAINLALEGREMAAPLLLLAALLAISIPVVPLLLAGILREQGNE